MATRSPSAKTRRSKAEVEAEFEKVQEMIIEEKDNQPIASTAIREQREADVRTAVRDVSPETIVQKVGLLELEIGRALSGLSAQLLNESKTLQSLREAVELERQELTRLHQVDIAKTAVAQLIDEHAKLKEELETEMIGTRNRWVEEKERVAAEQKQAKDEWTRQQQREKADYEYKRDLEREREKDQFEADRRTLERQNQERQQDLEKSWASREAALKGCEDELAALRRQVAEFPERIKSESARAVEDRVRVLQAEHKQLFALSQKEAESEKRMAEFRIKTLEEVVARQSEDNKSLTQRLEQAKAQVQEIALKAIEGASGSKALTHVSQIAMEQAKPRPQG